MDTMLSRRDWVTPDFLDDSFAPIECWPSVKPTTFMTTSRRKYYLRLWWWQRTNERWLARELSNLSLYLTMTWQGIIQLFLNPNKLQTCRLRREVLRNLALSIKRTCDTRLRSLVIVTNISTSVYSSNHPSLQFSSSLFLLSSCHVEMLTSWTSPRLASPSYHLVNRIFLISVAIKREPLCLMARY